MAPKSNRIEIGSAHGLSGVWNGPYRHSSDCARNATQCPITVCLSHDETELRKADRTVGVNCYIHTDFPILRQARSDFFSPGMFTTEKKTLQFKQPK